MSYKKDGQNGSVGGMTMDVREFQQQVEEQISNMTNQIEEFHKSIAEGSFEKLQNIDAISNQVDQFKTVHDDMVAKLYDFVRDVNEKGGELARQILDKAGA